MFLKLRDIELDINQEDVCMQEIGCATSKEIKNKSYINKRYLKISYATKHSEKKLYEEMVSFHCLHDYGTYHVDFGSFWFVTNQWIFIDCVTVHLERNMGFFISLQAVRIIGNFHVILIP